MKTLSVILAASFILFGGIPQAFSAESVKEKAADTAQDTGRAITKGWNRTKEAVCMEGDVKCAAKKAKNRLEEGTEAAKDKVKETKNSLDSDSDVN